VHQGSGAGAGVGGEGDEPGRSGPFATREIAPGEAGPVVLAYEPDVDGAPDPGEIVWTWVPYEEADGRGKDRPVLVVARDGEAVLGVFLTSKPHRESGYVPIGSGPWDDRGRPSWACAERVLRVHERGMRREACVLDPLPFARVAADLSRRYGWRPGRAR